MSVSAPATLRLTRAEWAGRADEHARRVDAATAGHRDRRDRDESHPIEDFLFRYYSATPAHLRRWHPGPGVLLEGGAAADCARWRHYRTVGADLELDVASWLEARAESATFVRRLLRATLARAPRLNCFGLHEWAMVYRAQPGDVRHEHVPLRLGQAATDAVVEAHRIACSHADAYRFFTEDARPHNALTPTRDSQLALEQPGCLHAGMDTYKWATKLSPLIPSDLTMDCFDLAMEIRTLDMQASPYDLSDYAIEAVPIETAAGKAAYVEQQRNFAERSNVLRRRLIDVIDSVLPEHPAN